MLKFEWDEAKNRQNFRKHGLWFEEVTGVFDDPAGRLYFDSDHSEKRKPMKKEYNFSKMKEAKNPYPSQKKAVGINLSSEVITYFKAQAALTGIPYQKLIDLYLLDCVRKRRKPSLKWTA